MEGWGTDTREEGVEGWGTDTREEGVEGWGADTRERALSPPPPGAASLTRFSVHSGRLHPPALQRPPPELPHVAAEMVSTCEKELPDAV